MFSDIFRDIFVKMKTSTPTIQTINPIRQNSNIEKQRRGVLIG